MQKIIPIINPNSTGNDIANLQDALLFLINKNIIKILLSPNHPTMEDMEQWTKMLKEEKAASFFGEGTRNLVFTFQLQQGLGDNLKGVVEEKTAVALNKLLDTWGAFDLPLKSFIVRGTVSTYFNMPYNIATVKAFDKDLRSEEFLGEAITNEEGYYEISYYRDKFHKADNARADIFIEVFDETGISFGKSVIFFNADDIQEINFNITARLSEWEVLNTALLSLLKNQKKNDNDNSFTNLSPAELEPEDIDFLSKETQLEDYKIRQWALAFKLSGTMKNIPEAFFYGWLKAGLPEQKENLWKIPVTELVEILKQAMINNIIPVSMESLLEQVKNEIERLIVEPGNTLLHEKIEILSSNFENRQDLLDEFTKLYLDNKGDWSVIKPILVNSPNFPEQTISKLLFTLQLSDWSNNNKVLINSFQQESAVNSLWDIGLNFSKTNLSEKIPDEAIPVSETKEAFTEALFNGLYNSVPTAVIVNMIADPNLPFWNNESGKYVAGILKKSPEFNIKTSSVYELIHNKDLLNSIPKEIKEQVEMDLKTVQRISLISPVPEAIPALINNNYLSAYTVTQLPATQFIASMKNSGLTSETLLFIYDQAEKKKIYYEHSMLAIKEAGERTGIAMIDGNLQIKDDLYKVDPGVQEILAKNNLSWDLLFGDADFCECSECTSVYSAAAYYVDLLQYLRNNNIDPDYVRENHKDINGTPLEKLLSRRPDLGHLELTCKNTNTALPYVDLVNEVMEQYIAFKLMPKNFQEYKGFNVTDETSGELLSAPRHTEQDKAYQALQFALFPMSLPYHQPIDTARLFLNKLNSSRYEMIDTFRSNLPGINFNMAADAEFLGLTEEEYRILTREYFNGLPDNRKTEEYYGLKNEINWLEVLSLVKKELVPRTGIVYEDLVELLKTQYLNPFLPKGENLIILRILLLSDTYVDVLKHYTENEMDYFDQNNGLAEYFTSMNYDQTTQLQKLADFFTNTSKSIVLNSPNNNCSLDETRLIHFDGTTLTEFEYDKIQRFIRFRNKLEFSIEETDSSIINLGEGNITPALLHQLVAIKKIMTITGLELIKLICFWGNISAAGDNSLYKSLFLSYNLLAVDKVFEIDDHGVFLKGNPILSDHLPVVMAALNLSADDIESIRLYNSLPEPLPLTLGNLSLLYRFRLLSKTLGLRIPAFIKLLEVFGNVFIDPDTTFQFLQNLKKIEDSGFTFDQLSFIINGVDNSRSFSPAQKEVIMLARKIADGQSKINFDHADLKAESNAITEAEKLKSIRDKASSELIRSKISLLYDSATAEIIISILEGTILYITPAPILTINPVFPVNLQNKVKYNKTVTPATTICSLQVTGALTDAEVILLKAISNRADWMSTVDEIRKQQEALYKDTISGIFATNPLEEAVIKSENNNTSAPIKRSAFLDVFLPFLREKLMHQYIVNALSEHINLNKAILHELVLNILKTDGFSLYDKLTSNTVLPVPAIVDLSWNGKLIPTSGDQFTFIVRTEMLTPFKISLDNLVLIEQTGIQPIGPIERRSTEIELKAGKVYQLSTERISLTDLYWKSKTSSIEQISLYNLLPDFKEKATSDVFIEIGKMSVLINVLSLSIDELNYFHAHKADFNNIDFNNLDLLHFLRIIDYCNLRNLLPQANINVLQFWEHLNDQQTDLSEHIANLTKWKKENIDKLISTSHFNLNKSHFKNEQNLLKLQHALSVASKTGMDIDKLFEWAVPDSNFSACKIIADSIQKNLRAQYNQTDWEQVVKPLNDQLRNHQKNALIAFLLQQNEIKTAGVNDADGLFEYFLIDVQMDACMETSRIKQAISSVQLFIQRYFLRLEKEIGSNLLDRKRWDWMERYRVWEANRKVFLYPENWIESNLRDDKSSFFRELESELLQKDINKQNVTDALKNYFHKVDEIANMEVVGLYIEGEKKSGTNWKKGNKLHIFSRTRNAPFFFYYRYLALDEMNWYPWEKMQLDIPCYDVEDAIGKIIGSGCYLTPVVWNGRLLVFYPQFIKKSKPLDAVQNIDLAFLADLPAKAQQATEYWEIKLAYSEYKNKKWQPKQIGSPVLLDIPNEVFFSQLVVQLLSIKRAMSALVISIDKLEKEIENLQNQLQGAVSDADSPLQINLLTQIISKSASKAGLVSQLNTKNTGYANQRTAVENYQRNPISKISGYLIFTVIYNNNQSLAIKVFRNQSRIGMFEFDGNAIKLNTNSPINVNSYFPTSFQYLNSSFQSIQVPADYTDNFMFTVPPAVMNNQSPFYFSNSTQLSNRLNGEQLNSFFQYNLQILDKENNFGVLWGNAADNGYHELKKPYSLYNWELFFHVPVMIADVLSKSRQYEESMKWFHFVFNPLADGEDDKRFWEFRPFKEINSKNILEQIFNRLKANEPDAAISEWRNNPFKPHVVARSRPVAYMKWVVMKYIDNILEWGDYLYKQDTIESINQASQLYILAGHILGPKPMMIPKRGEVKSQTYLSLLGKWDAFSNAMSEMEISAIYSMPPAQNGPNSNGYATADLFGTAGSLYFCKPKNPKLLGYWDTLADRLFKIRHCQNIAGVFRKLPLFEPPIDPALLVKAAAQGLSISSVISDLNAAMPNYRFYYLMQKAMELCNELKSLGGAMLSAIEKKDNETVSLIRARHESTMNKLVMEIKKIQLEEAQKSLESLHQNRKAPESKMKYYLQLIGESEDKVPGAEVDFNELPNSIEKPVDESGLKLIKFEKEDMDKSEEAHNWQKAVGITETMASIFHLIPMLAGDIKPFGIGAGVSWGGPMLGNAAQAVAKGMEVRVGDLSFEASKASKKGGFQRVLQDRVLQTNTVGYELKQIDRQITAQQIRIGIAKQEILNQQKQSENVKEIEEFLKNKYTNEELYTWMRGNLRTLYFQVYNLAYDLAKKAEKTYCFERGISNANFIQPGYFDAGRDGLLSGEQLYSGLKLLEAAYQEKREYDYEITKNVSLNQLDPHALLQLKVTNKTEFELPEVLFDMDFPGHYNRRIKSVSISIPCVAGPYTSVNTTLRLLNNKFRNSSMANNYPEKTDEHDDRFVSFNIPITAIATSSAQNDAGMFELNFKDERYLPFEGAGVVSRWELELPATIKQFDYSTISDVVLHIRYTASDGGQQLKDSANSIVKSQLNKIIQQWNENGLHVPVSLRHDMSYEWNMLIKDGFTNIKIDKNRLPFMAQTLGNVSVSFTIFSKLSLERLRCSVQPDVAISFTLIPKTDLYMSNSITVSLGSDFKLYGYKTGTTPPSDFQKKDADNSELKLLDDIVLIIKYILI